MLPIQERLVGYNPTGDLIAIIWFEEGFAGGMAVYDDAATKRIGDYAEIYNPTGDLIAITWFDKLAF